MNPFLWLYAFYQDGFEADIHHKELFINETSNWKYALAGLQIISGSISGKRNKDSNINSLLNFYIPSVYPLGLFLPTILSSRFPF